MAEWRARIMPILPRAPRSLHNAKLSVSMLPGLVPESAEFPEVPKDQTGHLSFAGRAAGRPRTTSPGGTDAIHSRQKAHQGGEDAYYDEKERNEVEWEARISSRLLTPTGPTSQSITEALRSISPSQTPQNETHGKNKDDAARERTDPSEAAGAVKGEAVRRGRRRRSSVFGGTQAAGGASMSTEAQINAIQAHLPSARRELEALIDPMGDFDWHFLGEVLGAPARDQRVVAMAKKEMAGSHSASTSIGQDHDVGKACMEDGLRGVDDSRTEALAPAEAEAGLPEGARHAGAPMLDRKEEQRVAGKLGHAGGYARKAELERSRGLTSHPGPGAADRGAADTLAARSIGATEAGDVDPDQLAFVQELLGWGEDRRTRWLQRALQVTRMLWQDAGMSRRDQDMFLSAHGRAEGGEGQALPPGELLSRCLAVAEHMSLLADHSAATDTVRAAAELRERLVQDLRDTLAHTRSKLSRRLMSALQDIQRGVETSLRPSGLPPNGQLDTGTRGLGAGKDPRLGELERSATKRDAGLSVPERDSLLQGRVRVRVLLLHLLRSSLSIAEGVARWRRSMWRPHPFLFRGRNLLRAIRKDTRFLLEDSTPALLQLLAVPFDEIKLLLAFSFPPQPNSPPAARSGTRPGESDATGATGSGKDVPQDPLSVGSVVDLVEVNEVIPDPRILDRLDRAVRMVHLEAGLQQRLRRETARLNEEHLFIPVLRWRRKGKI